MDKFILDKQLRVGKPAGFSIGKKHIDIDFHFMEGIPHMLENTDARKMLQQVKDTGAETVMIYAKDHWGNVYHNTEVANKHSAVKNDLLGEWLDAAKDLGLKTIVFFSLMWDQYAAKHNPDWVSRNADGSIKYWYGNWKFLSLNSPYRDYIFAHMKELVTNYDMDMLFVDPFNGRLGVNVPDYNEYDQKLYRAMYGRDIPKVLQGRDKARYMDFRDKFFARFLKELYALIRQNNEKVKISHIYGGNTDYDDYLNVEGDPFGQDYYAVSMKAKVYRAYAEGRPLVMLTERFNRYWDFVPKSRQQIEWELSSAFSHNISSMLVDHADIKGEVDQQAYDDIKKAYETTENLLKNIDEITDVLAEVALLYHERDEELVLGQKALHDVPEEEQHRATVYRGYLPDFVGAFKYLTETHTPFDVVVQSQLTAEVLDRYKMLVVPGTIHMGEEQIQAVRAYVERGGKLVFTYRTACRDLYTEPHREENALFGFQTADIDDPYPTHFVKPLVACDIPYIRLNNENLLVSPRTEFETLGLVQLPATARTIERFVTHNEPPGEVTEYPAVLRGKYGKGEYIYFSYRAFAELLEQDVAGYRKLIKKAVESIYTPSVEVEASRNVEANYYRGAKGELKVFLTAMSVGRLAGRYDLLTPSPEPYSYPCNIEEHVPLANVRIWCEDGYTGAVTAGGEKLKVEKVDGRTCVTLPSLSCYEVITLS
ncbi:beta-galactosidase trimerization domain-containing protein [Ruminococcaceae bacterium OttesenSCG-928-I18]|nr:beta-galactosidase trimerization domain-containing protein [Ruminococcaceae bacterium OttesenSCG-928-I18]